MPTSISPWFTGAPLTPLRKRDGGVRLVAVGETLRRLTSSWLMSKVRARAASLLQPHQVGVATPSGTEAIVHAARALVDEHGSNAGMGMLQIDFVNAFNTASRSAMLRAVDRHVPELLPWTHMCYGTNACPHLWSNTFHMRSVTGVQQGDLLGPCYSHLCFSPSPTRLLTV